MITRPANSQMLFSLAVAILDQYSHEDIGNVANPMLDDFIATMRVHPSPEAVAKEAAKVMFTRYRECSHDAQQRLFTLAERCAEEAQHSDELPQTSPYVWVSMRDEAYAINYARLLIKLSPVLEAEFFIDQLASMVFCASDPIGITFTIAKLVYQHLPPMQRFSPETIKILTEGTFSTDSLNIQGTFSAQILEAIENTYRMIILVNKSPSNGDPQPTTFMRKHLES